MFSDTLANFEIVGDELVYEYTQEQEGDLCVYIFNAYTNEVYGIKRFFSTTHADINIAPYIRQAAVPTPSLGGLGLNYTFGGWTSVFLQCGAHYSNDYSIANNWAAMAARGVLFRSSSMRTIAYGEQDIITIRVPAGEQCVIDCKSYWSSTLGSSQRHIVDAEYDELYHYRISASSFKKETTHILVEVTVGGVSQTIRYDFVYRLDDAIRLAWVNSYGGYEHFTLEKLLGEQVAPDGRKVYHYTSAYESAENIRALAEIIHSKYVWRVDDEGYHPITILNDGFEVIMNGEISLAEIKYCDNV